jgi:hypothetical protein
VSPHPGFLHQKTRFSTDNNSPAWTVGKGQRNEGLIGPAYDFPRFVFGKTKTKRWV